MRKRKTNEIKRLAKRALQGNFGTAILGVLIAFGTNIGASMLAGALFDSSTTWGLILCQVFLFVISLVTGILTAGLYYMYLNMARDRAFGLGDLVYFFKNCPDRVIVAGFVLALIDLVASIPYYCYSYLVVPGSSTQEWMDWAVRLTELMLLACFEPAFESALCYDLFLSGRQPGNRRDRGTPPQCPHDEGE